jgi:hypothetical protein
MKKHINPGRLLLLNGIVLLLFVPVLVNGFTNRLLSNHSSEAVVFQQDTCEEPELEFEEWMFDQNYLSNLEKPFIRHREIVKRHRFGISHLEFGGVLMKKGSPQQLNSSINPKTEKQ